MSKKIRILSIDGGGIRGVIPGIILTHVEKIIQKKTGDKNAKLASYFDFFAGTSTGGILVGLYLCPEEDNPLMPRFSAQHAVDLYLKRGPLIFNTSAWKRFTSLRGLNEEIYSEEALEGYLKAYFRDVKLSQLVKPCLITAYEIEKRRTFFFSKSDAAQDSKVDFYLRDVARATSAAPIYFKASRINSLSGNIYSFVDGGLFANNPALCGLTDVLKLFSLPEKPISIKDIQLFSLGTGIKKTPIDYKEASEYGAIGWVKPILHILSSGNNETIDYQVDQLFKTYNVPNQYLRLSPELESASAELDDASLENMLALKLAGEQCAIEHTQRLEAFVDLLLESY